MLRRVALHGGRCFLGGISGVGVVVLAWLEIRGHRFGRMGMIR